MRKPIIALMGILLAATGCTTDKVRLESTNPTPLEMGDSTVYGLACDGSNDTIVVFLNDPYEGADPDTLNILDATRHNRVYGVIHTGDKLAIVRNDSDATHADMVIVTQDLLGNWAYKVWPRMKRHAELDSLPDDLLGSLTRDSLRRLLSAEREYMLAFRPDSMMFATGTRPEPGDDTSPVAYPTARRYREWCIKNGRLLLTEVSSTDSTGNTTPLVTDTAQLILLTEDSLVLRLPEGTRHYYRKDE